MNKCFKCGAEFEGNFCPECGAKHEETKTCPQCGKELDGQIKFCNECGYSFIKQEVEQPATNIVQIQQVANASYEFTPKFYRNTHKLLNLLPLVFFALFVILNFVFMACEAASYKISWGSVYTMTHDFDYHSYAVALIVFAAIACAFTFIYIFAKNVSNRKIKILVNIVAYVIYLCIVIVAVALYVAINKDGLQVQSATKLLIAFSVIFAALSLISSCVDAFLKKHNSKYADALNNQDQKPSFVQKVVHKSKQYYQSNTKKSKRIFFTTVSLVLICVLVFGVMIPITTSDFYPNKLAKINLGDSKETVEQLLGKPDSKTDYQWVYYGNYLKNIYEKEHALNEWSENIEDFEDLGDLFDIATIIDEKSKQISDKLLTITFDRDENVNSLSMDKHYNDGRYVDKSVKKVTLGKKNTVNIVDLINESVSVHTFYKDGSFDLTALPQTATSSNTSDNSYGYYGNSQGKSSFPSSGTVTWTDDNGTHSVNVKYDESTFDFSWKFNSNQLELYGTVPTKAINDFFQTQYQWLRGNESRVKTILIDGSVTNIPDIAGLVWSEEVLETIIVDDSNPFYSSANGILFNKDKTEVIYVPKGNDNLFSTEWYNAQPEGLMYSNNTLYGYKGTMPANYQLQVREGTTSIGSNAFSGQTNLISVILPQSLSSISAGAFSNTGITSITIPENVTYAGGNAFYNCSNLTTVHWNAINCTYSGKHYNSIVYDPVFERCNSISNVEFGEKVEVIPNYLFYGCDGIRNLFIPNSVAIIGEYAFCFCDYLTSVVFEDNSQLNSIGREAFRCRNLQTVSFGSNSQLKRINIYAFSDCERLTSITIPASVDYISARAFDDCTNLTSVTFENPNGWTRRATNGNPIEISPADLANPTLAAQYLVSLYSEYYWSRS